MFQRKKDSPDINQSSQTAKDLVGVRSIRNNFLDTVDGQLYGYIKVRADGDKLLSNDTKKQKYEMMLRELEKETQPFVISSVPVSISTYDLLYYLEEIKRSTDLSNTSRINLIDGEIDEVRELTNRGIREPFIYLRVWDKADNKGAKVLGERIDDLIKRLTSVTGIRAERMKNYEIAHLCRQFTQLGVPIDDENRTYERVGIENESSSEVSLINEITPYGITLEQQQISIAGTSARILGVSGFPKSLAYMWETKIMNNTDCVTSILYEPLAADILADALSYTVQQSSGNVYNARSRREEKDQLREMKEADSLIDKVDGDGVPMGMCTILTMPFAEKESDLKDITEEVKSIFRKSGLALRTAQDLQLDGLKSVLPYHQFSKYIKQQFSRLLPLYTVIGGSPFVIDSLRDKKGILFAYSDNGGAVSLDTWYRGEDRTNSNFILTGKPGTGKSTTAKSIILNEIMRGTKVIIIDPQREYSKLTLKCNGEVINMSGGKSIVNLLEVTTPIVDTEQFKSDDEIDIYMNSKEYQELITSNRLATHIKEIMAVFRSYFKDAGEVELSILELCITETYKRKDITWETDTSTLEPEDFPIIEDILNVVKERTENKTEVEKLIPRLETMVNGAGKFMFNGHTNVKTQSQIICFDVYDLQTLDSNVKSAQFLNLIQFAWKKMTANRKEPYLLVVDEAYTMIDPSHPTPIAKLRDISKQARKFESALGVITHDIVDLLHDSIRVYGQALINTATYKYFMGTDGKNLIETKEMFGLTNEQVDVLRKGTRGTAITLIGSIIFSLNVYIADYKMDYMGDAGGR